MNSDDELWRRRAVIADGETSGDVHGGGEPHGRSNARRLIDREISSAIDFSARGLDSVKVDAQLRCVRGSPAAPVELGALLYGEGHVMDVAFHARRGLPRDGDRANDPGCPTA
jgi:hypothetical protein